MFTQVSDHVQAKAFNPEVKLVVFCPETNVHTGVILVAFTDLYHEIVPAVFPVNVSGAELPLQITMLPSGITPA